MKATKFVPLAVGILLAAAQFVAMYFDARYGVAHSRGEVAIALPAHR